MVVWYYLDLGCVLRNLTGIPCPTCGASRAILSLLTFNLKGYFYYHPIALALLLTVHTTAFPSKYRKFIIVYMVAAVILTLILYFYRLLNGLIP